MHQLDQSPVFRDEYFIRNIQPGGLSGDKAIISLYTQYHKIIMTAISDLVKIYPGCRAEPADIMHDAFLIMVYKIQFESVQIKSLQGFWIGIARNIILNQVKKNKRIILVEDYEADYGVHDVSAETLFLITEENEQINKYFSMIGGRCKQILVMWYAQCTMEEIATALNLSGAGMARKVKCACFKKLKNLIKKGHMFDL